MINCSRFVNNAKFANDETKGLPILHRKLPSENAIGAKHSVISENTPKRAAQKVNRADQ